MDVGAAALDSVQSFGRMVMLAPALKKKLRSGSVDQTQVVAACCAMGRTKFFDGDILEEIYSVLRRLLSSDKLDTIHTNDAIKSLRILNAGDKRLFSAVA